MAWLVWREKMPKVIRPILSAWWALCLLFSDPADPVCELG